MTLKKHINHEFEHLKNTFKLINKAYWITVLFDIILAIILSVAVFIFATQVYGIFVDFQQNNSLNLFGTEISNFDTETLDMTSQNIQDLFYNVIFFSSLFIIFSLLFFSLMKSLIYTRLLNKKSTIKFYFKFLLINFIWLIIWSLVFAFIFKFVRFELQFLFNILATLLLFYFTILLFTSFTIDEKFLLTLKHIWKLIKKTHLFIFPYIFIFIIFLILNLISIAFTFLPSFYENIISALILICFLAWARIYIISIVKRLLKSKD